jgi:hypothetical protein
MLVIYEYNTFMQGLLLMDSYKKIYKLLDVTKVKWYKVEYEHN